MLVPHHFLDAADDLVSAANGRPRQANLRRAISSVYYAYFHTLCRCCADTLIGHSAVAHTKRAWTQAYRTLEHKFAKDRCDPKKGVDKAVLARFPNDIRIFADKFSSSQELRHRADYYPIEIFYKSTVTSEIAQARIVIDNFKKVDIRDRRAFAAWVCLRSRHN